MGVEMLFELDRALRYGVALPRAQVRRPRLEPGPPAGGAQLSSKCRGVESEI